MVTMGPLDTAVVACTSAHVAFGCGKPITGALGNAPRGFLPCIVELLV
jgi:hypothetical protein